MASNAVPPSVTYPSPNEWPNTIREITNITKTPQAVVTSPSHGFTSTDEGQTFIGFLQVRGMQQINGLNALVQTVIDANNFTVNINSSQFFPYASGGVFSIISGIPPVETIGFQTFNTPFHNVFTDN